MRAIMIMHTYFILRVTKVLLAAAILAAPLAAHAHGKHPKAAKPAPAPDLRSSGLDVVQKVKIGDLQFRSIDLDISTKKDPQFSRKDLKFRVEAIKQ